MRYVIYTQKYSGKFIGFISKANSLHDRWFTVSPNFRYARRFSTRREVNMWVAQMRQRELKGISGFKKNKVEIKIKRC